MEDKTILIAGGIGLAAVVLFMLTKTSTVAAQTNAQIASQQLALQGQYQQTTAGQVGGILSSVGSFINTGTLQNLTQAFSGGVPSANQPGLIDPTGYNISDVQSLNDPGLMSA